VFRRPSSDPRELTDSMRRFVQSEYDEDSSSPARR